MTVCMSHTRLLITESGRNSTTSARDMEEQPPNVAIKLTRPDPLHMRVLIPKALPLTQGIIRSNWKPHLKPYFLHPIYPKNNGDLSWPGPRETRGPGGSWAQWLLEILHTLPSIWCLLICPVPNHPILFTLTFSVALMDPCHLLQSPTVLWSLHGPHYCTSRLLETGSFTLPPTGTWSPDERVKMAPENLLLT